MAESGLDVTLFEAAPKLGGRTRSFIDKTTGELCDNGPHLLIGAYAATQRLLAVSGAASNVSWQSSLSLPLWDEQRHHFQLKPTSWLPFPIALLAAVKALPGHGWNSVAAMLRLAKAMQRAENGGGTVAELIQNCRIPSKLVSDMLEPICLGSMNEAIDSADAATFMRILRESFASRSCARLGWFNKPLEIALIEPLAAYARRLGVEVHTRSRIRSVEASGDSVNIDGTIYDGAVIALPAYAADALMGRSIQRETRCISNIHLWYRDHDGLPEPFVGGIGTVGQWFFDLSAQMHNNSAPLRHICAVISDDRYEIDDTQLVDRIAAELNRISSNCANPCHYRIVREKRATVLVRPAHHVEGTFTRIIDASEAPVPGDLPATIELAVERGEKAASSVLESLNLPPLST